MALRISFHFAWRHLVIVSFLASIQLLCTQPVLAQRESDHRPLPADADELVAMMTDEH